MVAIMCPFWCGAVFFWGLFLDFRRTSGGQAIVERKGALEEEGGAVVGVFCFIPSSLASGP